MNKELEREEWEELRAEALAHYEEAAKSIGCKMINIPIAINYYIDRQIRKEKTDKEVKQVSKWVGWFIAALLIGLLMLIGLSIKCFME